MKSKFQPDVESSGRLAASARLIDPEAYDASEQQFAASVEEKPAVRRFVADSGQEPSSTLIAEDSGFQADGSEPTGDPASARDKENGSGDQKGLEALTVDASLQNAPPDSWRREVADRVNNYRTRRRPRAPRYPSLQLKFESRESSWTAPDRDRQSPITAAPNRLAVARQDAVPEADQSSQPGFDDADYLSLTDAGARILEFPRSAASPPPRFDELAEPVLEGPRILDVPEVVLPPPALGGILMEPVEEPPRERRPGFELPLQAAPMSRRLVAVAIDSLLVASAFAGFAYIFFRVTSIIPTLQQAAGFSISLIALFWTAYQYLLLVYTGTTPGLKLAHLQLSRFDGAPVPRRIRRWRVLASVLSGLSLALGYAWCFLDEDRLCWHDRITHTYMAPQDSRWERFEVGLNIDSRI